MDFIRMLRPAHWTKNLFVFAAVVFGRKLIGPVDEMLIAIGSSVGAFFCFSLASSAVYIFNDIIDRKVDLLHPRKRHRPIASGKVGIAPAGVIAVFCAAMAVFAAFELAENLAFIILLYIALMVIYSLLLKKVMILDCVTISIGFCLRAVAGAVVVGVFISPWLIICTFALCLFLAFSKRRSEIAQLGPEGELFRRTLSGYNLELLAHMLDVTSGLAIVCFLLYAMDERTMRVFGTNNLVYTTPLVLYCVFRFSALIQKGVYSGPVELVTKDLGFQIGFCLWVLSCIGIIYANRFGFGVVSLWAY